MSLLLTLILSTAAAVPDEHARLSARRAEIEARHAADTQACQQRFAVNACLDEARIRRNIALKPIELRENELDAAERRERSAAQKRRVAENQREFEAEQARRAAAAQARAASAMAPPAPAASRPVRMEPQVHYRAAEAQRAQDAEAAQRRAALARDRQEQLKARQQAAEKRAADKAAEGRKPVAPLPLPKASGSN